MTKAHADQKTTLTPAQYAAGSRDSRPSRSNVSSSSDDYLEVHHVGTHEADVTEGLHAVWERPDHDWSDPNRVVLTTTDSNTWSSEITAEPLQSRRHRRARRGLIAGGVRS